MRRPTSTQACSVEGCTAPAQFHVFLYDEYVDGTVFNQEDFTCPRLCSAHRDENEARAVGARRPRGRVRYPFTNRHVAQGWSVYEPIQSPDKVTAP